MNVEVNSTGLPIVLQNILTPMIITAKNSEKRRIEGAIQHELFYEKLNCQTSMSFLAKTGYR